MAQAVLRIEDLPASPLDAAAKFHGEWLPKARTLLQGGLVLVFQAADYTHRGWRLAAVQDLAREAAPQRINAIVGDDEDAIAATVGWLVQAPGVTGQLLAVG